MALNNNQKRLLHYLKQVALELGYEGKTLTPLIGELSACKLLGLKWEPSVGYDALGSEGRRFQIKTRKSWSTEKVNSKGRVGRFGNKGRYDFDQGIFVELGKGFEVTQIWQASREEIMYLEAKKIEGRGLHVHEMRHFTRVYP